MKGYVKASRHYFDAALVQKDGRVVPGAGYDEVVDITARYTGAKPENIRLGFPYQDRNGRLLVPDIEKQIKWWVTHGFMKEALPVKDVVDYLLRRGRGEAAGPVRARRRRVAASVSPCYHSGS